jgi:hypothetical protein
MNQKEKNQNFSQKYADHTLCAKLIDAAAFSFPLCFNHPINNVALRAANHLSYDWGQLIIITTR